MKPVVARLCFGLSACAAVIACLFTDPVSSRTPELRRSSVARSHTPGASATNSAVAQSMISQVYAKLPQRFEANRGGGDWRFVSRGGGFAIFLKETEAALWLRNGDQGTWKTTSLRMKLAQANRNPRIVGLDEQPGKSHYFIGDDSRRWSTGVPAYSRVRYEQVWPGVDLIWYGDGRRLEHDFIVAPGADPARIVLSFEGQQRMSVDREGALVLQTEGGELRLLKPVAWQESDGGRREIACDYRLSKTNQIKFAVNEYDRSRALVIDPVLAYSTYLSGTSTDNGLGVAVDKDGAAYITGSTLSMDFPGASAIQPVKGNLFDAFVLKLNPPGSAIAYATWLGGASNDNGNSIAEDRWRVETGSGRQRRRIRDEAQRGGQCAGLLNVSWRRQF
jgi:hypothetical protein